MFAKKFFAVAISILFANMMFFMLSCDKSSPTGGSSTGTVDAALVGVWFNRSDSSGSEIIADGKVIPLKLDNNKFLVAASIGTDTYTLSATGGSYTLTIKTKVEGTTRDTTITLKGTYTVTATTLTTTDPSGTTVYTKSAYNVNVFTPGGGGGLTATPTSISVVIGSNATSTISGGTAPYTIQTAPSSSIATATISSSTLSITGVAAGSTSVTVKDNASPAKTVSIPITVTTSGGGGGFTTAGTISFSSNKGNFTANGIYNGNATTGSGAGAMTMSSGGSNILQVTGYRVNSATSIDIAILQFMDSAPIATGSFVSPSTGSKSVTVLYFPANNPNDTTQNFYMLTTATANISAISSSNAQGTFSGNGMYSANGTLVPSNTIAVTSGTFNVPVIPLIALNVLPQPINSKIEGIIKRIVSLR